MPLNPRVYYPIHAVGFAPVGTSITASGYRAAKGVQNVGVSTNFALEQIFQLGQLSLYENIENLPEVEVTVSKVADGRSLIQHLATPTATAKSLAGRFNDNQCMTALAFYPITNDAASGTALSYVQLSGAYVSNISWEFPLEGNITESITLSCRDKQWIYGPSGSLWTSATQFTGNESPVLSSGGVQRRENVLMGSGANFSIWPTDIPGIDVNGFNPSGAGGFGAHIQSVSVSTSLARTDLLEQGRRGPYFRYPNFPVEVTCSIQVTASESGDQKNAFQDQENLTDQRIVIRLQDGTRIDLGNKNKLASITLDGGDTGGGNKTVTYNYTNFNDYTCTNPTTDPAGLAH